MNWISVKDKLPDFEEIIIFTDGSRIAFGEYNEKTQSKYFYLNNTNVRDEFLKNDPEINEEKCGFISEYAPWSEIDSSEVTHWMPLPKTPEVK